MLIENQGNNKILIKFSDLRSFDFQRLIDYARFLEIRAKSKAKKKDINALANSVSENWWKKKLKNDLFSENSYKRECIQSYFKSGCKIYFTTNDLIQN